MSRFNQQVPTTKTINLAGGEAYGQSPELELMSILLTSFAGDAYYRKADDTFERLKHLTGVCNKLFVAQAAIYARTVYGMRSISHVVASHLARHISGQEWATRFYAAIVYRPDDMMEILSFHKANNGKIPNAMKKGFAAAFGKFDAYQLAKYKGAGKEFSLVDVVNLVHPMPCEKNAEALKALVKNDLKSFDTWESKLSEAGQKAENDDEKAEFKKEAWAELIRSKKIGYFALLRNLRNILAQAPEVVPEALAMLTDEKLISKSLVLPFRYATAYEEIKKSGTDAASRITLTAISKAVDIACRNVPQFDGDTCVVLDVSGSMEGKPANIGSLFSAVLIKACNADFVRFSDSAKYTNVNPADSTLTIAGAIKFSSGGTNFNSIFDTLNKKYDRVIILSDMQGWIGHHTPTYAASAYRMRFKANPFIYSFDLQNYGTMQFPEQKVFAMAGFSDKIFDVMKMLETDKNALVNEVRKVVIKKTVILVNSISLCLSLDTILLSLRFRIIRSPLYILLRQNLKWCWRNLKAGLPGAGIAGMGWESL